MGMGSQGGIGGGIGGRNSGMGGGRQSSFGSGNRGSGIGSSSRSGSGGFGSSRGSSRDSGGFGSTRSGAFGGDPLDKFSDQEKEIRTMCEQSAIPKALVDIAVTEPAKVPGISPTLAARIHEWFHEGGAG